MYGLLDGDWLSEMNICTELEMADSPADINCSLSDFIPGLSFSGSFAFFGVLKERVKRGTGERDAERFKERERERESVCVCV